MQSPMSRLGQGLLQRARSHTCALRQHSHGGVPGENLPFSINNRYKLTLYFTLFLGSGLAAPYLITRHQLLKK